LDRDNGRTKSSDAIEEAGHAGSGTADGSWEYFGCVRIPYEISSIQERGRVVNLQNSVHDVLEERFKASKCELEVRVRRDREQEDEHSCDDGGHRHGTLSTNVFDVDSPACDDRSGNTHDGSYSVVAVDSGVVVGNVTTGIFQVLWKEGVKQRVRHSNCCPLEPQQTGGETELLVFEQGAESLHRESAEGAFNDFERAKLDIFAGGLSVSAHVVQNIPNFEVRFHVL
jgi:hypothetical protein